MNSLKPTVSYPKDLNNTIFKICQSPDGDKTAVAKSLQFESKNIPASILGVYLT